MSNKLLKLIEEERKKKRRGYHAPKPDAAQSTDYPRHNGLRIGAVNIRSFLAEGKEKKKEVEDLMRQHLFKIFVIEETGLKPETNNEKLTINGYKLEREDKPECKGKGILIYVHNDITHRRIEIPDKYQKKMGGVELIHIEITKPYKFDILAVYARPIHIDRIKLIEVISEYLINIDGSDKKIMFIGDMNICRYRQRHKRFHLAFNIFERECGIRQIVTNYTRDKACLDHIDTNIPEGDIVKEEHVMKNEYIDSDHNVIYCTIKDQTDATQNPSPMLRRRDPIQFVNCQLSRCGKTFKDNTEKSKHEKTHPECDVCPKQHRELFMTQFDLDDHKTKIHKCKANGCSKMFNDGDKKLKHENEKHYTCPKCSMLCKNKADLQKHRTSHHTCRKHGCKEEFATLQDREKHEKSRHPWKCDHDQCKKIFDCEKDLNRHIENMHS